jgi:hypothetical protein
LKTLRFSKKTGLETVKKLELHIEKLGSFALRVAVVTQAEELSYPILYTDGRFSIRTYNRPEITNDSLYVRGKNQEYDNDQHVHLYSTTQDREAMYQFLIKAQREINEV